MSWWLYYGCYCTPDNLESFNVSAHWRVGRSSSSMPWQAFSPLCLRQEPITRSEQLLCARVKAFSRTSLFLERFWSEFLIPFKFHKPVSKTYRNKSDIFPVMFFPVLITFISCTSIIDVVKILFSREKCFKLCLKINWSVKTPWRRPRWQLLAPVMGFCLRFSFEAYFHWITKLENWTVLFKSVIRAWNLKAKLSSFFWFII